MDKETFCKLLKKIPKAEIHLHSEALISRDAASLILSRSNDKYKDKKNIDKLFSYKDLKGFINLFLLLQNGFKKLSDFEKLFKSILPYLKRNGIVHSELFFSPSNFLKNGLVFVDIIKIFIEEIKRIRQKEDRYKNNY
jgi:adenosine deaminase